MAAGSLISPEAMQHAVFVGDFRFGGAVAVVENLFDAAGGVRVEHEDLAEVRVGRFEQVETIALGLGQGVLVPENDLLGVVVQFAEGDKAAPLLDYIAVPGTLNAANKRRCRALFPEPGSLFAPGAKVARGPGIDVFATLGIK